MTDTAKTSEPAEPREVSPRDLALWGAGLCAYAKPILVEGQTVYGIFGADGQQLGVASNAQAARMAIRENDLEPVRLN